MSDQELTGVRSDDLHYEGKTYLKITEGHTGRKATQVAKMLKYLMENPGMPVRFEYLCEMGGAKYPADVQAAVMALEMVELLDMYKHPDEGNKIFYAWNDNS